MANIVLQLQKNSIDSILNANNFLFDETVSSIGNISYDALTGVITIPDNGLYMVDWWVSILSTVGSTNSIVKLISDKGHEFSSNLVVKVGNMSGLAVLDIDDAPIQLSLVNESNGTIFFSDMTVCKSALRVYTLNSDPVDNSRCFALNQLTHVLEQIVALYPGTDVSIFSSRFATVTGTINSLYKAPTSGNIPLLLLGTEPVAFNIDQISVLYFPNMPFDSSITYLTPPDPFPQNCDTDTIQNFYQYVSPGDNVSITLAPTTAASGEVTLNEYAMLVMADDTSSMFVMTPDIVTLQITGATPGMRGRQPLSISTT